MTVVDAAPRVSTLVELLQVRANRLIDKPCLRFLTDGEDEQHCLTYEQLDLRARAFAGRLVSIAAPGDRAVLVYPPGADFLVAFFGCVYAGVIAVPVAPPVDGVTVSRLAGVVRDSQPTCISRIPPWPISCAPQLIRRNRGFSPSTTARPPTPRIGFQGESTRTR